MEVPPTLSSGRQKQYAVFPLQQFLQQQAPQVQEVRRQIETTSTDDVSVLTDKMRDILFAPPGRFPDAATQVKVLRQVLDRFLQVSRQSNEPFRFPIETSSSAEAAAVAGGTDGVIRQPFFGRLVNEIESAAGMTYKNRAKGLMQRLSQIPEMGWNARYELLVRNGEDVVAGSNVVTLVTDAVKPPRRTFPAPTGWREFSKILRDNNVSSAFIGNTPRYLEQRQIAMADLVPSQAAFTPDSLLPSSEETIAGLSTAKRKRTKSGSVKTTKIFPIPSSSAANWEWEASKFAKKKAKETPPARRKISPRPPSAAASIEEQEEEDADI